jgi:gas vesicle protein
MNTIVVAVLAGASTGAITAAIYALANRDKTSAEADKFGAEAADLITKAATDLLDKALKQAGETELKLVKEVQRLERRIDLLSQAVESLTRQLTENGLEPNLPENFGTR